MNVTLNSQVSATKPASAETTTTTTYKPQTATQTTWGSGVRTDIADRVMDNEAYGHGLTAEDIMQQAANTDVSVQKDFMVVMSSCVSGEDLRKMQEDGFNPASTDVETYVNVVDQIKVTLAQAGVEIAGYNDDLDVEKIEEITGSRINAETLVKDLSKMLTESDIPVTNENVQELVRAIMEASGITEISDEAIKYLVVNHKAPTIENVYKAQFSGSGTMQQSQGYYSEGIAGGSYYAKKADSINWENLETQMESVIKQAGLDSDAMDAAKWLVESGIELNVENLTLVSDLRNLKLPIEQQDLEKLCVTAMENGKMPTKALMTGEEPIAKQAKELMETVEGISDEAVHEVAESGDRMNIKNLAQAQKAIDAAPRTDVTEGTADEASLKEIEAKRQLEEIRLMMSEEANRHLLKAGITIDTAELSKLVDALKEMEEAMRASLFQGGNAEENAQRALLFEETIARTKALADLPAAVVGKLAMSTQPYTLNRVYEEGEALQKEFEQNADQQQQRRQASQAYETLMTAPRKDLGDNIKKAFRNVDDILEDMKLETSEANRRAVRILGYNSMEITEENINKVKEADSQISGVIGRMTPATTLQMIREQKNPLEMTIDELDAYLNDKSRDLDSDAEKYSVFLQKLDRAGDISESEREAYIGIYRLFHQIEKSDGAVIGSIVASGAQMNFKNMLSAIRSSADKDMDIRVDDGFGALEELITKGKAIDEQIMSGFHKENSDDTKQRQQEQYYARLSGEINTELANKTDVEKLKNVELSETTTIEQFADSIKTTQMSESPRKQEEWKQENLKNFQESLKEAQQIEEQVIESLIDYGQTISIDNIYAAELLMVDRGSLFKQIIEKSDSSEADEDTDIEDENASDDAEETLLDKSEQFVDALTGKENAGMAYKEIIDEAGKAVEKLIDKNGVSHIDVKAAQALYKGLALAGNLAKEENYEIPMNINGEITSVNLKIYHNAAQIGKVSITFETDLLGKVAAEFDVTDKSVSGMVVYEKTTGKRELEQVGQRIKTELAGTDKKSIGISLVQSNTVDFSRFGQDRQVQDVENNAVSTAMLYRTAKAFLTALKETERA